MINYVTFLEFKKILLSMVFFILPQTNSNYPVINISTFMNMHNLHQFLQPNNSGFDHLQHLIDSDIVYVASNSTELWQLKKSNLQIMSKKSLKSCNQGVCDKVKIELVQAYQEKSLLSVCFAYNSLNYERPFCYLMELKSPLNVKHLGQWIADSYVSNDFKHRSVQLALSDYIYSGIYLKEYKDLLVFKNSELTNKGSAGKFSLPSYFLKVPGDFIISFQYNQSIYFLYLETSFVCGFKNERLVTRVLKLCEKDSGIDRGNEKYEFSYFSKVDVQCESFSANKMIPSFKYRLATAAEWLTQTKQLVVTFTNDNKESTSSAICVYSIEEIEKAFNSDFKKDPENPTYQKNEYKDYCQQSEKSGNNISGMYNFIKSYPLHKIIVTTEAIFIEKETKFVKITSDESNWSTNRRIILFVSAETNTKISLFEISVKPKFCILRKFLFDENITMLKSINEYGKIVLFIGTSQRLVKMPMDICNTYFTGNKCLSAKSPFCFWNSFKSKCTYVNNEDDFNLNLKFSNYCPETTTNNLPINYKSMKSCRLMSMTNDSKEIGNCQCTTTRKDSDSITISVSDDCTINGDWTKFSSWSACTVTCGTGMQTRKRTCENPSPQNGGKWCEGNSQEVQACATGILCKGNTTSINNVKWNNWSKCSKSCGFSYQTRSQICTTNDCDKLQNQMRLCETKPCEYMIKSEWSQWSKLNVLKSLKTRLRFNCSVKYQHEPLNISFNYVISHDQLPECSFADCQSKYKDKSSKGKLNPWSEWSKCTPYCNNSDWTIQKRTCSESTCFGSIIDFKPCNNSFCQSLWSCWSPWVGCSSACETKEERRRYRKCLFEKHNSQCDGPNNEISECPLIPCSNAYSKWSQWSICSSDGIVTRHRKCKSKNPCLFPLIQSRPCSKQIKDKPAEYSFIFMIVSGLIGFVSGALIAAVLCYVWWKCTIQTINSYAESNKHSSVALQNDNQYDSQLLNIQSDGYNSIYRQRTPSNNETFFKSPSPQSYEASGSNIPIYPSYYVQPSVVFQQ